MQTMQAVTVVPRSDQKTLNVFGIGVDLLLRAQDTAGAFSTYRVTVQPGDGVPPHIHHNEDESFYVMQGEFEVICGDEVLRVTPGSQVFLPRYTAHAFRNVGTQVGQLLGVSSPSGHELFFEDASLLGSDGPPDMEAAIAVCRKHGIEMLMAG